jgi:hypothetical protein
MYEPLWAPAQDLDIPLALNWTRASRPRLSKKFFSQV